MHGRQSNRPKGTGAEFRNPLPQCARLIDKTRPKLRSRSRTGSKPEQHARTRARSGVSGFFPGVPVAFRSPFPFSLSRLLPFPFPFPFGLRHGGGGGFPRGARFVVMCMCVCLCACVCSVCGYMYVYGLCQWLRLCRCVEAPCVWCGRGPWTCPWCLGCLLSVRCGCSCIVKENW